jgi:hypothetical protein
MLARFFYNITWAAHSDKCWYTVYGLYYARQPTLWSFKKGGDEHDVTPQLSIQRDADNPTRLPHRFKYTKATTPCSILFISTCCGNRGGNRTSTFRSLMNSKTSSPLCIYLTTLRHTAFDSIRTRADRLDHFRFLLLFSYLFLCVI